MFIINYKCWTIGAKLALPIKEVDETDDELKQTFRWTNPRITGYKDK